MSGTAKRVNLVKKSQIDQFLVKFFDFYCHWWHVWKDKRMRLV